MDSWSPSWGGSCLVGVGGRCAELNEFPRSYQEAQVALRIHRSTLKYRLGRIRQISGHDLGLPDAQFNLQLATRAWRTLQALRQS